MAVNRTSWRSAPIADRDQEFDADDAIARLIQRSSTPSEFGKAFLYREDGADPANRESYRLPILDVVGNKLALIPHAVYAAAALLSGAHGGLPNVPDKQKDQIRDVISEIYVKLRETFNDPRIRPPWDRGQPPERRSDANMTIDYTFGFSEGDEVMLPFTVNYYNNTTGTTNPTIPTITLSPNFTLVDEDEETGEEEFAVKGGDPDKPYGDVEYADPGYRGKARYPIDTEKHVRAAWSYINQEDNAAEYTPEQLKQVKARIVKAAKELGIEINDSEDEMAKKKTQKDTYAALVAAISSVAPDSSVFEAPTPTGPTPLTVTEDGRVFGHLAQWGSCHTGIGNSCVSPPKSITGYKYFHTGEVVCSDGKHLPVGKITLGVGHANAQLGFIPAIEHYDSSATCAAIVQAREDKHGIFVSGVTVPGLSDEKVAELRRSPLSGDWRRIGGNLELVAALAVNTPGFPIVRETDGKQMSLVAAGIVQVETQVTDDTETGERLDVTSRVKALQEYLEGLATEARIRRFKKLSEKV